MDTTTLKNDSLATNSMSLFFADYSQESLFRALRRYVSLQGMDEKTCNYFKENFCTGLSIVFSTFFNLKKRLWWTQLLKAIINNQALFSTEGYLEQSADDWNLVQVEQPQTHRELIERVINYVLFSHATPCTLAPSMRMELSGETYHQQLYLKAQPPLTLRERKTLSKREQREYESQIRHEYLSNNGIETIVASDTISGNFDAPLLMKALDVNDIKDNIMKVSSAEHTCALIFNKHKKLFGFYDPDSPLGDAQWFDNKETLVDHIFESLETHELVIYCASTKPAPLMFHSFKQAMKQPKTIKTLSDKQAMPFVFAQTPSFAMSLFEALRQQKDFYKTLVTDTIHRYAIEEPIEGFPDYVLENIMTHDSFNASKQQEITTLFSKRCSDGNTHLYHLAVSAPEVLCYLLKIQNTQPKGIISELNTALKIQPLETWPTQPKASIQNKIEQLTTSHTQAHKPQYRLM